MKFKIIVIIFFILANSEFYSQNKFSIGYNAGMIISDPTKFHNGKLGFGYNILINHRTSDNLHSYILFGQLTHGKDNNFIHNVSLNQFAVGSKYYFKLNKAFSLFLLAEGHYYFGDFVKGSRERIGTSFSEKIFKQSHEKNITSFGVSSGFGVRHQVSDIISINLQANLGLYDEDTDAYNCKLFLGFEYAF
jgi:hypothetical protein